MRTREAMLLPWQAKCLYDNTDHIGKDTYTMSNTAHSKDREDKKILPLRILEILKEHSDEDHPLTSTQIISRLERDYGLKATRNTIRSNLRVLIDAGYKISTFEDNGNGIYIEGGELDHRQLRWLVDSVLNCRYLPENRARELITTLKKMGGPSFCSSMDYADALKQWPRHSNQQFSFSLELLEDAIESGRRVSFNYNRMDCDGELHQLGDTHLVLPICIFPVNYQYYMVGHDFGADMLLHYRLDRMTGTKIAELPIDEDKKLKPLDFNAVQYARQHPHMYGGTPEPITMKMPRRLAGAVMDTFGPAALMRPLDDEFMQVRVNAAPEGMRFFALQYGPSCEVLSPQELRDIIKQDIIGMMEKYSD